MIYQILMRTVVCTALCVLSTVNRCPAALIQNTPAVGTLGHSEPAYADTPRVLPPSMRFGIQLPAVIPAVTLSEISNDALLAEDALESLRARSQGDRLPLRYGIGRDFNPEPDTGLWIDGPSGSSLWVLEIRSPSALGIRVHLSDVAMPEGAELFAYAPELPSLTEGPYSGRGVLDSGEIWIPTTFSETCRLEFVLPRGLPRVLPFRIDSIQHIYRDLWKVIDPTAEIGSCHGDVTCFPAWANTAKASAGIGSVVGGVSLYCSGTLLATTAADQTPYWLTANHCLSTAGQAASVEVFWLYQTSTCNGTAPDLASVPRSSVATLVSASAATDHSLILLRGALPANLHFAGWSSSRPPASAQVACISHPTGSWKRYATGIYTGPSTFMGASVVRCDWATGGIEPGSSGGGLFLASTQQLVGQLYGGSSSVCQPFQWGAFGDFSLTYANFSAVSAALAAGTDDSSEPNNTCVGARSLSGTTGTLTGRIVKSTSEDWYSISVPAGRTATISLANITNTYGNVDLQLLTACGGAVTASSTGTGSSEVASYSNRTTSAVTLYSRVFLASSVRNTYDLSWSVVTTPVPPSNDLCSAATNIPVTGGTLTGTTVNATIDGTATCGGTPAGPDVWYVFTAPASGTLLLHTCGSALDTVLSVFSACGGTQLSCNDQAAAGPCVGSNASYVSQALGAGQSVRIRLAGFNGAVGAFTLAASWSPSITPTPPANDACGSAVAIGSAGGSFSGSTLGATVDGAAACAAIPGAPDVWYSFSAPAAGVLTLQTCGSTTNTVVSMHSACGGTQLACNDQATAGPCSGTSASYIAQTLSAGQSIRIRVASVGTQGDFVLAAAWVATPPGPSNDRCVNALPIFGGVTSFNTANATTDGPTDTLCISGSPNAIDKDIWFAYLAACTGTVTVNSCGPTGFDTVIGIYTGCPTTNNQALACNNNFACGSGGGLRSQVVFSAVSGRNYLIRVGGVNGASGSGTLAITCTVPPPPPSACNPADVVDSGGVAPGDGTLDGSDFIAFINSFALGNAVADPVADLSGDGTIDGEDYIAFINAFAVGC